MSSISHYGLISGSKNDWHGVNATCSSDHALPSSFSLGPFLPTFEELVWTSQQTLKSEQERRAMAAQSLPVCDCHGAASPQHKNQRTMTPADRESGFPWHLPRHSCAWQGVYNGNHFPFLSFCICFSFPLSDIFHSGESNTFFKTNQENIYVFGWEHTILLHNSGPAWLTPSLFRHTSVHLCGFGVFLQLSFRPFTYFPYKITESIQTFKVHFDG